MCYFIIFFAEIFFHINCITICILNVISIIFYFVPYFAPFDSIPIICLFSTTFVFIVCNEVFMIRIYARFIFIFITYIVVIDNINAFFWI